MLRAENICKKYFRETDESNYFTAVEPVSFELKKGSLTVLMGRSGSGKSTLLSMLAGLLTPSEGKIYVNDTDIYSLSDKELSVFVPRIRARFCVFCKTVPNGVLSKLTIYDIIAPETNHRGVGNERFLRAR